MVTAMAKVEKSLARISFETVGSIVAIIVGIAALFVAWDEAKSVRKQQAASVLPVLKINSLNLNEVDGSITSIIVKNVGIGPAFVENAAIYWGDEKLPSMEAVRQRIEEDGNYYGFWTARLEGEILAGSEEFNLLTVTVPAGPDSNARTNALRTTLYQNLGVDACFCSVYEDCWTTSLNKKYRPEPVDECRRSEAM